MEHSIVDWYLIALLFDDVNAGQFIFGASFNLIDFNPQFEGLDSGLVALDDTSDVHVLLEYPAAHRGVTPQDTGV